MTSSSVKLAISLSLLEWLLLLIRESGDPSKRKPYLPSDKQFLITRNGKIFRVDVCLVSECTLFYGLFTGWQYLVYGELHLWQKIMKLLEVKCWLMMKIMMVGWRHMGNQKVDFVLRD